MTGGQDNPQPRDEQRRSRERPAEELPANSVDNAEVAPGAPEDDFALDGEDSATNLPDEVDPFLPEDAQLSPEERVGEGMGTVALDRVPGERRGANGLVAGERVRGPRQASVRELAQGELARLSDAEIMQRAGVGDEVCFDFLVAKYRRPMIGFLYRMCHNQGIAEELTQEVFLRIYRARESYRAEARFTTWLYRIASNVAINHARDTKNERVSSSVFLDQPDAETGTTPDVPDMHPRADQQMLRDERMRRIREQVAALPERQRMAVVMHKYQEMDYREIGAVLKLSESATKSLLFRAYQTLRDRLKEFA